MTEEYSCVSSSLILGMNSMLTDSMVACSSTELSTTGLQSVAAVLKEPSLLSTTRVRREQFEVPVQR